MFCSLLLVGAVLLGYACIKHWWQARDFPPGPAKYPILGSIPSVGQATGSQVIISSTELAPKYGKVMGYFMGAIRLVFIQDFELAKEVAFDDRFSGKFISHYTTQLRGSNGTNTGIITTQGQTWKNQRRFALTSLKEFGFGKKSMGTIIAEESDDVVSHMETFHGKDFEVNQTFNIPVFNILWRIVAGKRYKHDDPEIRDLQRLLADVFKLMFRDLPFPLITYLFPSLVGVPEKKRHTSQLKAMFEKVVNEHLEDFDPDSQPKDFIDMYLKETRENPADYNKDHLIGICMDFFEAGGETVGSTLSWALMYLAMNEKQQEECFKEIDQTIGKRTPTLDDKDLLPYTEATIMEIQRMSCVAPGGLEHKPSEDIWLEGYRIPKDTLVYYNIHKFHTERSYWGDPEVFRPERFLQKSQDDDGSFKVVRPERFIPFGFGKRVCMGQSLAKAELFIFTVMLIQRLKIEPPKFSSRLDTEDYHSGITKSPNPFSVHLQVRN